MVNDDIIDHEMRAGKYRISYSFIYRNQRSVTSADADLCGLITELYTLHLLAFAFAFAATLSLRPSHADNPSQCLGVLNDSAVQGRPSPNLLDQREATFCQQVFEHWRFLAITLHFL